MKEEIGAAVCLMSRLVGRSERLAYGDAERFGRALGARLAQRFHDHWYPERPSRGQAYRCIRVNATQRADPVLVAACRDSGLRLVDLCLPRELTLWVDPCEVCCRYGEKNHAFTVARFDTAADRDDAARAMASLGHGDKPEDEALRTDSAISSLWPPLSSSSSSSSSTSSSTPSSDEEEEGGVAAAGQSRRPWPATAMTSGGTMARYAVPVTLAAAAPHGVATLAPTSVHFQHPAATMAHYQVAELVYHPLYMWPAHPASYPARRRRAPPIMRAGARVAGAGGPAAAATAGALPTTLSPHSGHFLGPSFIANATSPSDGKMRRGPNRAAITAATTTPPPGFGLHRSTAIGGRQQQQRVVSVAM
ncbi:protein BTG3-like [Lethenteron reissneri]|uniref:protein BTG3-like n=1 Tax=Lethenteron reissneri TaxID=7753 RepID=UPI002AB7A39E|nr:protein BTG3-like [Lethenteron reissneri]XP_061406977.1 protein BTG3-like [Lethenteron reissneri]XP_061406978.1 protein BTG3-like [Lethenteron reissneri]